MTDREGGGRHSVPLSADLVTDPQEKAERESLNALRQFDRGIDIIRLHVEDGRPFKLRPSVLLGLHRVALDGLSAYAGNYRPAGIEIKGSVHKPVGAHLIPERIEDMCDYVNERWKEATALHLAAYCMWRLNWIHPFADGNGRTSRILSYIVLSVHLGDILSGTKTIPDQITDNRQPYFEALDAADAADRDGRMDVSAMENLLRDQLAAQLYSVVERAGVSNPDT
jgi:Fic family protein